MKRILVLRGGALGDFIVTLPALSRLRDRWPKATIELAGNSTAAELGRDAGLLDRVHSQHEARWAQLYGDTPLSVEFAGELAAFDLVVSFWPDPEGEVRRKFPRHGGQVFILGAAMPQRAPAAAHYCEVLREFGLEGGPAWYALGTPRPGARKVAIHPGSGSKTKNWPLDRWVELARWLKSEMAAELLIVSGEADTAAADALGKLGESARGLPLRELTARFGKCRLFLGHDSGVSHLAAACGVSSVLLFGPTDPAMWAPPAPHVAVLRPGVTLEAISPALVQQAVRMALAEGR